MAFYISGPKLLFETTEISTHSNSTQQESNYIYLYTTKFGTSIKIRLNQKFESTEFETMRVNCIYFFKYWHRMNEPFGIYKIFLYMCTYMHNTPINNDLIGRFWNTNLVHDSFMTLRSDIHFDKRRFI
jgi:hypothetical protein